MLVRNSVVRFFISILFFLNIFTISPIYAASDEATVENGTDRGQILSTFVGDNRGELIESFDERRDQHRFLFFMGITLLVFVLLTAGFGVSMAMLGKNVFVPHMICAGVSVFLSIAHAIVAIVWFFPF